MTVTPVRSRASAPSGVPSATVPLSVQAVENGWSCDVLWLQIAGNLRKRLAAAPSNFAGQLPAADSDLARQLTKDPYVFDFLDLTSMVMTAAALRHRLGWFVLAPRGPWAVYR